MKRTNLCYREKWMSKIPGAGCCTRIGVKNLGLDPHTVCKREAFYEREVGLSKI